MAEVPSTTGPRRSRGGTGQPPLLEVRGVTKSFPGVRALRGVDLAFHAGRVHALIGENGAGKSTLTSIVGGVQQPDAGELLVEGVPTRFAGPRDALRAGIAVVHQELSLLPDLTVEQNIYLGHEPARRGVVSAKALRERAGALLAELGAGSLPPRAPTRRLSVAQQQIVEIAKALAHDARLLIMDEPSAVLAGAELDRLFELIERLAGRGVAVAYISHRLAEVEAIADDVTVLRDGAVVSSGPAAGLGRDEMVRRMVGRSLDETFPERRGAVGDVVLAVDGLLLPGTEPEGLSLTLRAGEILGVSGLVGSGRSRLGRALVGLEASAGGTVTVGGQHLRHPTVRSAAAAGLVLLPEDRKTMGLVLDLPVAANLSMAVLSRVSRLGVLSRAAETALASDTIRRLGVRASSPRQPARQLSGGNQQKVVLGKWLAANPRVLILDEPLRGVDVGAKAEIYELVRALADDGVAVLLISSELQEILGLADRVLVMRDGRIAGGLDRDDASEETILALAIGEAVPA